MAKKAAESNIISGGVVSVEDGTKAAEEFAPARKVRIELHFEVPEGTAAEAHLDYVSLLASHKVAELLGRASARTLDFKPVAPSGKTKEDLAKAAGVDAAAVAAATPAAPKKPPATAKPAEDDELNPPAQTTAKPADDGLEDILGMPKAIPVTDADLTSAITKKNAVLKAPPKIRELIAKFTPEGKAPSAAGIPQEKRNEFLTALEALA